MMETARITVDRELARERLKQYREAKAPATPQDIAIMRAYRQVARGKVIIRAHESIRQAGFDEKCRPKLALCRATWKRTRCDVWSSHTEFKNAKEWSGRNALRVLMPRPEGITYHVSGEAIVPLIPLHLRPRGSLYPYFILWEADWTAAPVDPMLLRKLSGDLYLVVAAWDLTDIERAAIEGAL